MGSWRYIHIRFPPWWSQCVDVSEGQKGTTRANPPKFIKVGLAKVSWWRQVTHFRVTNGAPLKYISPGKKQNVCQTLSATDTWESS